MIDYTQLLDDLAETGNLTASCRNVGVKKTTFLDACARDAELADRYTRAREAGLDTEADRAIEEATQATDAGLARVALDARKWYLSKLMPKRYGDKIETVHSGSVEITSKEQRDAAVAAATRADR